MVCKTLFQYVVESQLQLHGLDVEKCMLMIQPREVSKKYKYKSSLLDNTDLRRSV